MIQRTSLFFQKGRVFEVTDWVRPAWEGEFVVTVKASGSKKEKGQKGGPDVRYEWSVDRAMEARLQSPEWDQEAAIAKGNEESDVSILEISNDTKRYKVTDFSSQTSRDVEAAFSAEGPVELQQAGRNQLQLFSRAEPSGYGRLHTWPESGQYSLSLEPFFAAKAQIFNYERSRGRSHTENRVGPYDLLQGVHPSDLTDVGTYDPASGMITGKKQSTPVVPYLTCPGSTRRSNSPTPSATTPRLPKTRARTLMPLKNTPIDERLGDYISRHHSGAGDPLLAELREETARIAGDLARMQVSEEQGTFLGILAAATGAKRAIEIGTFTGASALCIARAIGPQGRLLCCDVSREWTDLARRYWARTDVADRIDLRLGPAIDPLRALPNGVEFDFAFIDADKPGYDTYYEAVLPRMRAGSLILFDNALQCGRVADPSDENARAIAALNAKLVADPRVECALITVSDGIMVCRKR